MTDPNPKAELQRLITLHRRRLQKLQEQRARQGQTTDAAILMEIEDIEAELQRLEEQVEMENQAKSSIDPAQLESYLRCVGDELRHLDFSLFQEGQEREFAHVSLDRFYVPLRIAGRPAFEEEGLPGGPPDPPVQGRTGFSDEPGIEAELTQAPSPQPSGEETASRPRGRGSFASPPPGGIEGGPAGDLRSTQLLDPAQRLGRHLALLGDAGSGKTTILRHLAGALAEAYRTQDAELARERTGLSGAPRIPLFVRLRYYHHFCRDAAQPQPINWGSFLAFLPDYFKTWHGLDLPGDFFETLLRSGACVLALDGFDEVPDSDSRRQVIKLVQQLATKADVGRNIIILSSRRAAYGGEHQLGGQFQTLWVQNLNAEERAEQVQRWVEGIGPHTQRALEAEDILKRMPEGSPLDQLAVTPMIVTTLCVVYFYDHELPEQRAQLYRRCVDIMLYEKLRPDDPGRSLADLAGKPDFKRQLLARLAFKLHRAEKEAVTREQAARWLRDGFKSLEEEERLPEAYRFLDTVSSRGTLLQERDRLFGFGRQHLTFKEFLAGLHLITGMRARERKKLWPALLLDDRWREPIRLAVGATVLEQSLTAEEFLEELLELAESDDPAARLAGYRLAAEALWDVGGHGRKLLEEGLQSDIRTGLAGSANRAGHCRPGRQPADRAGRGRPGVGPVGRSA